MERTMKKENRRALFQNPNPMLVKELRGRVRGPRAFIVLTVYLLLLSCVVSLIYYAAAESMRSPGTQADMAEVGKAIFSGIVLLEILMVTFVTPATTAGAISGERERKTYELLRTTLLPARKLVFGKLSSAVAYVLLLIFAAIPLQGLAFLLGGVVVAELILALAVLLVTAVSFGAAGLFFSSWMRRNRFSTIVTNAYVLLVLFGLPLLAIGVGSVLVPLLVYGNPTATGTAMEEALLIAAYILASFHPLGAPIITSLGITETGSIWTMPVTASLSLPSAWILYVVMHLILSLVLFAWTVRRVKRQERQ